VGAESAEIISNHHILKTDRHFSLIKVDNSSIYLASSYQDINLDLTFFVSFKSYGKMHVITFKITKMAYLNVCTKHILVRLILSVFTSRLTQ